jgi:3-hydroxyacyl-CoA dehydrogenase/enoyl-CoA hydratase/3-hydroxybutyryl-CoA epimerase
MTAFGEVLSRIESDPAVRAVVLISAKVGTGTSILLCRVFALEPIRRHLSLTNANSTLLVMQPDNFVAGADISMLDRATSAAELTALSKEGQVRACAGAITPHSIACANVMARCLQRMMDRLAACPKPVVAAIHGSALGGGLELAMACHYRIGTSSTKTRLGLPEVQVRVRLGCCYCHYDCYCRYYFWYHDVGSLAAYVFTAVQLGLLPGAGGTQRLPRFIGIQQALTIMTTGQNVKPDKARKLGLLHEASSCYDGA